MHPALTVPGKGVKDRRARCLGGRPRLPHRSGQAHRPGWTRFGEFRMGAVTEPVEHDEDHWQPVVGRAWVVFAIVGCLGHGDGVVCGHGVVGPGRLLGAPDMLMERVPSANQRSIRLETAGGTNACHDRSPVAISARI